MDLFPLITGITDESRHGDAKDSTGHAEAAVPEESCSKGRKQLLARLRNSIIERDQATKRKVDELLTMQVNSNTGSDQGCDSRGTNVAAINKDPSKAESSKVGMQPSINR